MEHTSLLDPLPDSNSNPISPLTHAAWHCEDAFVGYFNAFDRKPTNSDRAKYTNHKKVQKLIPYLLFSLILITFFERPLWCISSSSCSAPSNDYIYLSSISYLNKTVSIPLEISVCLLLLFTNYLQCSLRTNKNTTRRRILPAKITFTILILLESLFFISTDMTYRISPFLRIALVCLSDQCFPLLCEVYQILTAFTQVLVLYVGSWVFFGWILAMVLKDAENKQIPRCAGSQNCENVNTGFSTLTEAIYTMMLAATTSNYPNVVAPSYSYFRMIGLLWTSFYFVSNFLLLNLVLSVIYSEYSEFFKNRVLLYFSNRMKSLKHAFMLLENGKGSVNKEQIAALLQKLTIKIPPNHVEYLFAKLDADNSNHIDLEEFVEFADILQFSYKRVSSISLIEKCLKGAKNTYRNLEQFQNHINSPQFRKIITLILLANTVAVVLESIDELQFKDLEFLSALNWLRLNTLFSVLYVVELFLRAGVANSLDMFWMSYSNRVDAVITIIMALGSAWEWLDIAAEHSFILRCVVALRLFRLVSRTKHMSFLASCLSSMAAGCGPVLLVLFCAIAMFALVGVQAFGGLIHGGNDDDDDYMDNFLDVFNFNDVLMAIGTLMSVLVSQPHAEMIDGFSDRSSWGKVGVTIFFMGFTYIVGLLFFNIFVSFVIAAFMTQVGLKNSKFGNESDNVGIENAEQLTDKQGFRVKDVGFKVFVFAPSGQDFLWKEMFKEELASILN